MESVVSQINQVRDAEQKKALNNWAADGYVGSIIAGTGFGKSRCGVLAIEYALKHGGNALILVPTVQLQDQFIEEFLPQVVCSNSNCEVVDKQGNAKIANFEKIK